MHIDQCLLPTKTFNAIDGVRIEIFGRSTGNGRATRSWSMRSLSTPEHERPPDWGERCEQILRLASAHGSKRVLVPLPFRFNARIVTRDHLRETVCIYHGIPLRTGAFADGIVLPRNTASFHPSGDCPTIIAKDERNGVVITAHAGRDSLVDRGAIEGRRPRQWQSVVDSICARMKEISAVHVAIVCGIGPSFFCHSWDHPKHGSRNRRLIHYIVHRWGTDCILGHPAEGRINLTTLIRKQFATHGISPDNIAADGVDTYADTGEDGQPLFYSHHRGDEERNGVLVVRVR